MTSAESSVGSIPAWVLETMLSTEVLVVLADGTITWVSPSVCALLGWSQGQITGRSLASLTHPADALIVDPPPPLSPGRPQPLKRRRLLHSDGRYRWVAGVAMPRHDDLDRRGTTLLRLYDATDDLAEHDRDSGCGLDEDADWRWLPSALDASPDGFAIFRVHRRLADTREPAITVQMINKVGAAPYQIEPRLLRGRMLEEMAPPEVAIPLRELVTRCTANAGLQRRRIMVELPGWDTILDLAAVGLDPARVVVTWRDVSTQVQAETVLMDAYARAQTAWDLLHDILGSLPDPVMLIDGRAAEQAGGMPDQPFDGNAEEGRLTCQFINQAAARFLDVDEADVPGTPLQRILPASCRAEVLALVGAVARTQQGRQTRLTTSSPHPPNGQLPRSVDMLVTASPTTGGRIAVVCRDVTAEAQDRRRLQEQRLSAEQALRLDPLTGLPNRLGLESVLHQLLLSCPADRRVAVLFCDLSIETVNATLGMRRGDQLLKDTARALTHALPDADVVARLGSGEFVTVLAGRTPDWTPAPVLAAIHAEVATCWPHGQVDFRADLSHYLADPAQRPSDRDGADVLNSAITEIRTRIRDSRTL